MTTNTHTQIEIEVLALGECAQEDCDHEDGCPTMAATACLECNAARQGTTDVAEWEGPVAPCERRAPVQGTRPGSISWEEHLEVWDAYAKRYGTKQSAERIAERGGFGYLEIELFTGKHPRTFRSE